MIGIGISIPMMMPFAEDPTVFIRQGVLRSPFVLTRAQTVGVQSTAINASGTGLDFFGADIPRFNSPSRRLLIEDQGTNTIQNPRCEGAVAGSPGTMPTLWGVSGSSVGLTRTVVASGVENGIPYVDLRFNGTATAGTNVDIFLDAVSTSAASGQTWTGSVYIRRIGGSLTNISSPAIYVREWSSGFIFLNQFSLGVSSDFSNLLDSRRVLVATLANASTALVDLAFQFNPTVGSPVDVTFRIGAPQLKQLPFADTPSFPPLGTPGASTRGADFVSASLSSLGIGSNGACTVLFRGLCPVDFSLVTEGQLACISDGGFSNFARLVITGAGGAGQLVLANRTAGVDTIAVLGGGARPTGTLFNCGVAFHGTGRVTGVWNGSSVGEALGAPASGYTTMDLFHLRGILPLICEPQKVVVLPQALSDANLQAAVNGLT